MRKILLSILFGVGCGMTAPLTPLYAQPTPASREYTEDNKLIFTGAWDLWPYSFLNDKGEPDGFDIDVIRLVLHELGIPYTIKLKPRNEAYADLRDGRADLMFSLAAGFHDEYGFYGKNAITLFTQSVASPKDKSVGVRTFKDLEHNQVIVREGSLSHHLMMDYGWTDNAHVTENIREALQQISAADEGQVVWNDLSLKWLIRRYHIENLRVTPVNMPHCEYKFMSRDTILLDRLDEAYSRLYTAERLTPIQNKWFYPDRQQQRLPEWVWWAVGAAGVLIIVMLVYAVSYRFQARRLNRENSRRNKRMGLIIETSQVRIWTYDIARHEFTWRNENGLPAYTYSEDVFARRYSHEDYKRVSEALRELAGQPPLRRGEQEKELTLHVKARDTEDSDTEFRDFVVHLSVLSRDNHGHPQVIVGTKKDVTREQEQKRQNDELAMRYMAIVNTPIVGIMLFDRDGYLININERACEIFGCDHDEIVADHVQLRDILDTGDIDLHNVNGFSSTQVIDLDAIPIEKRKVLAIRRKGQLCNEFSLLTVNDEKGELLGVFAICKDVTDSRIDAARKHTAQAELVQLKAMLSESETYIDRLLHESDIRLVNYTPATHTLCVFRSATEVQHSLTQTRCMALVNDRSKRVAMRTLASMDERQDRDISVSITTALRVHGMPLNLHFSLTPVRDTDGSVTEYYGLCRDISELRDVEQRTAVERATVQDVENTKTSFVNNMVQEIRKPMDAIVESVGQLDPAAPSPGEKAIIKNLLDNSNTLLHLINNILHLSRLQAHMVEINRRPTDFAKLFETQCTEGWHQYRNAETQYIVESPYEQLIIDIDPDNLGQVISQLTANAAQHTTSGSVRARYDYIGRRLIISIDDTGEGITAAELERINKLDVNATPETKGLGLAICRETVSQMGGTIELSSERGSGTTVYVTIPCHATTIKRKRHT